MEFEEKTPIITDPAAGSSTDESPGARCWTKCLDIVRRRVNSQSYKTWFEPIAPVKLDGNDFYLQVPSQFFSEWLEENYFSLIKEAFAQVTGRDAVIHYLVKTEDREEFPLIEETPERSGVLFDQPILRPEPQGFSLFRGRTPVPELTSTLNRRYTFENYIKGESNQFASAAALAVANNPGGTSFNPLVIYGGVGLGKTHLVHAIGNQLLKADPSKRVLYTSSEKFTVDFVESIQRDNVSEFSNYYRSVDLLMVDDIQFFTGKEKTQDIFFHTFNTLHQMGKQIVLSSDKPPKDLKGLDERLISRFQWGLTADIQPPDLETRIAILKKKSEDYGLLLPGDILEYIATNIVSNIRELEGCLIKLLANASLSSKSIDIELARKTVKEIATDRKINITIENITSLICDFLKVDENKIRDKTRKKEIVLARQIAMFLSKELTKSSLKTIGLHFGGRDHSTVIHSCNTIEASFSKDPSLKELVDKIKGQ